MRRVLVFFCMVISLGVSGVAHVGESLSFEQMREARQKGEIRSLRWVMHQLQTAYPGRLLDAELLKKNGRYIYRIKLLQAGGYVSRLIVDAYTAEVLRERSRPKEKRKP